MNKTLTKLLLPVLLGLLSGAAADIPASGDDAPGAVLLRMALVVSDIEESKRFYSYALGYEVSYDGDITRPAVIEQLQLEEGQTAHFVVLRGADKIGERELTGAMIGLLQVSNPALPAMHRPGPATMATGEAMMAIVTSDIQAVYERMLELESEILLPPTKYAGGNESELVVYDPDGIRIHVVERHVE
jgi:catechol 2,3-dioxygenase-like lactoylglutathione lyase family enzyme